MNFFIITNPKFTKYLLVELTECLKFLRADYKINEVYGGIELETDLKVGLKLNYYLKIAVRVLLRIDTFKVRDFPKLFKKVKKIDWPLFIDSSDISVKVSSEKSRLFNKEKITNAVNDGLKGFKFSKKLPITLYVRIINDICTLSLDLTGEPLYKSGLKKYVSIAPLRENIASLFINLAIEGLEGKIDMVDPMCGSGTISLVASNLHKKSKRKFYFKNEEIDAPRLNSASRFNKIIAKDLDIDVAKKNLQGYDVELMQEDIFNASGYNLSKNSVVLLNPPYNFRMRIENPAKYYKFLIDSVVSKYNPTRIGIITPIMPVPLAGYAIFKHLNFINGGLPVNMVIFSKIV